MKITAEGDSILWPWDLRVPCHGHNVEAADC